MKVICIAAQKGGVGKTTTALSLGMGLANLQKKKVLLVDMDPQQNLSFTFGKHNSTPSIFDCLIGKGTAETTILNIAPGVDLLPGDENLSSLDTMITQTGKEFRLKEILEPLKGEYDFCIVDTPPALGLLTINAMTAADDVLIPCNADAWSLQALTQIYETVTAIQRYTNPILKISGILINKYNPRQILSQRIAEMITDTAERMKSRVFSTKIRESVVIREAVAMGKDIFSYSKKSNIAADFQQIIKEITR